MIEDIAALSDSFFVAPQLAEADVRAAATAGFTLIVNNRPDDEEEDQPTSAAIARAAAAAGIDYAHVPVDSEGVAPRHAAAVARALLSAEPGKTLAFCLSGKRSALVWAHLQAAGGRPVEEIVEAAERAGFHLSSHYEALTRAARTHTSVSELPSLSPARRYYVAEYNRRPDACCAG